MLSKEFLQCIGYILGYLGHVKLIFCLASIDEKPNVLCILFST